MALMFGWKWSDGKWYDAPEPGTQPGQTRHTRRGVFRERLMSPQEVRDRCIRTREWLNDSLKRPTPAALIIERAKRRGIAITPLKRAKRHFGIKSYRVGGYGSRGIWIWARG